jgi:preprotein translocase subunit SecA
LAGDLKAVGIGCEVLNAKNDEREAGIVARAGERGAVTISTNMAGRGTDIRLGGADECEREEAVARGGLYVIGTNRHESLRIDRQLRGRSGRQGDPGQTRFFISLEDDLFERYGLSKIFTARHRITKSGGDIGTPALRREIEHAQRVIEGQNFDIRRQLAKYSHLIEMQRRIVQDRRDALLLAAPGIREHRPLASKLAPAEKFSAGDGAETEIWPLGGLKEKEPELYARAGLDPGPETLGAIERRAALHHLDRAWSDHLAWVQDTRESIHLVSLGGRTPIDEFRKQATEVYLSLRERVRDAAAEETAAILRRGESAAQTAARLKGPSSTWTYLVNDDQLGWGMQLMGGKNIGFTAIAAGAFGPLFVLTLLVNRLFRRKPKTPAAASQ